jgi:hypothetical protein
MSEHSDVNRPALRLRKEIRFKEEDAAVSDRETAAYETAVMAHLPGRVSRAQLLAGMGAGLAAALLPGAAAAEGLGTGSPRVLSFPFFPQVKGSYTTEAIMDIFNVLVTAAYLRATFVTSNITTGRVVPIPTEPPGSQLALRIAQADAAIEQYHIDFLTALGATPVTTTFTRAPADPATLEARQHVHVAMYMAAVRELAELGQSTLAKWAFQAGAIEAEDRAIFRILQALNGNAAGNPPNNKAFETDLLLYVRDALDLFKALGLIGGPGQPATYPGRHAVVAAAGPMARALLQKTPNNASWTIAFTGPAGVIGERA